MHELVNYIIYITHKILSAIIIGIADKFKIIIVIGDKKYWTDNANYTYSILLTVKAMWKHLLKKLVLISLLYNIHYTLYIVRSVGFPNFPATSSASGEHFCPEIIDI